MRSNLSPFGETLTNLVMREPIHVIDKEIVKVLHDQNTQPNTKQFTNSKM